MSGSVVQAWENAEQQCYAYLRGKLSATHNADSFVAEFPAGFALDTKRGVWMFAIGGEAGNAPLDYDWNMTNPGGGGAAPIWQMPANFIGFWTARADAIHAAGIIRTELPIVEGSLAGVFRFRIRREPSVTRAQMQVKADQAEGGMVRGWQLEYPLEVWFYKSPT